MKMLFAFLPFIAFAVLSGLGFSKLGLFAGGVIAAISIARDALAPGKIPKILDVGTCVLFSILTVVAWILSMDLSIALVRICVDTGLLILVLVTIAVGKPFTIEYAKDAVPPSKWNDPGFIVTNKAISAAWAGAFAIAVAADFALWRHALTTRLVSAVILGALYAAFRFTQWYPNYRRSLVDKKT